jgi:hypothetical protein
VAVRIYASALKHGIHEEDILHALDNSIRIFDLDDSFFMTVGPARDATLLEVGITRSGDPSTVVHAMRVRAKFLRRR